MSEAERIRRQNYKRNRKRWILAQIVLLTVVAAIALGSFLIYRRLNRTFYIEYTEDSSSDYTVHYKENNFFEEEWLGPGQSYVTSLVDGIMTDFHYELNMDVSNVAFDYTYEVFTQLVVSDKTSGAHIYDPIEAIVPKTTKSVSKSDTFSVDESVYIDFSKNNSLATKFISVYGLKNAKAALWITLKVDVVSASDDFEMNNENTHSVSLLVPLCEENFSIEDMTSLPSGESKVLACKKDGNQDVYYGVFVAMSTLAGILGMLLMAFAYFTKNEDVTYANRVRKLLNSYRSFIQRIYGEFDSTGYQLVQIKTFTELLSIRDTIQSPVLMSENKDETRAQFLIPTNTKILYLYEIKVDTYDELDGAHPEWVDDSLIKLDSEKGKEAPVEAVPEVEAVEAIAEPTVEYTAEPIVEFVDTEALKAEEEAEKQSKIIIDLYAELGKLREDLQATKEQKTEPVTPVVTTCQGGNMKFGHFTAGGNVTINYHEMPDEATLREAVKLFASKTDSADEKNNTESSDVANDSTDESVEIAVESEPIETLSDEPEEVNSDEVTEETSEETEQISDEAVEEPVEEIEAEPVEEAPTEEALVEEIAEPIEAEPEVIVEAEDETFETVDLIEEIADEETNNSDGDEDSESEGGIVFYDENENKLVIKCRRSCLANIIQSQNELTKAFYSELKNYIMSFKGVKARMSWRHESFNKGRQQLFKLKIRGKTICLYCALDPAEFDVNKYFHKAVDAKVF